uniref:replication helicase subunit n=1 Tax=Campylaephora boydenii TaxID=202204 RepID=UPI002551FFDE|nr:replication helicase subunit [Campylaephora boydenii]WGT74045.1 replication helicase subunit [Campylaephora boydenii]
MTLLKIYSTPPQNYLVEEILLGCILINPLIFSKVIHTIKIQSFFIESHQLIYINLLHIYYNNKLHPIELLYNLSDNENLQQIGGLKKIIELMKQSQIFIYSNNTNIYLDKLIEIINNNYTKRLVIQYGYNIIQLSYINKINGHLLYNKASHYLNITLNKMPVNYNNNFHELMKNTIYEMTTNSSQIIKHTIIKSGFVDLDQLTNGLPFGDLIILAGRPSMGKTSLAINIAYNILIKSTFSICIFSLEMSSKQILNKLISISSYIPYQDLIYFQNNNWTKIKTVCKKLLKSNIYIYDKTNASIDYIEYISKVWIQDNNQYGLVIIDYLQLIQIDNSINLNRVQQLSYITRKLKMLAQYLNIPILTLSQLNRSIEVRINKEPVLSDLKESGCINQNIATKVMNIYTYLLDIKSLIQYFQQCNHLKTYFLPLYLVNNNHIANISLKYQYIFHLVYQKTFIELTYNHKCLNNYQWQSICKFSENTPLVLLENKAKKLFKSILEYSFLWNIEYIKYNIVYDLSMISSIHFICQDIVLHNSIEQDADIVLMLYQKQADNQNLKHNKKIIDLVISKNRHGPTGSCQLLFLTDNTSFKDLSSNKINDLHIK